MLAAMKETFKRFLELVGDHDCEHRYVIHEGFHIYIEEFKSYEVMKIFYCKLSTNCRV